MEKRLPGLGCLATSELESIIDAIPGLVFYKDTENRYLRVNRYVADAHGMTKAEMVGMDCFDLYPREQAQAYWDDDLEVIRSGQAKLDIDELWETPSGRRWLSTSKIPARNEAGEIVGVIGVGMDVTERRRARREVEEHRSHLEELVGARTRTQDCLIRVTKLVAAFADSVPRLLQGVVEVLPSGFPAPELVCARITLDGEEYHTAPFRETPRRLASALNVPGGPRGLVEVFHGEAPSGQGAVSILDEAPEILAAVGRMLEQAVARRAAFVELRDSERYLQQLLDAACFGVVVIGKDRRIRSLNRAAVEMTGYESAAALIGETCHGVLCTTAWDACPILVLGQEVDQSERTLITADGREIPVIKSATLAHLDGEEVLLETFVDISDRLRAEASLVASEARVRQLFDISPDAVFVIAASGRFVDFNAAALTRYGYSREELLEMGPLDLAPADKSQRAEELGARAWSSPSRFEASHRTKGGAVVPVEIHTVLFTMDEQPCVLASVRDITERRRVEEERRQLQAQLNQSQRLESIGTLASGVAHEINNPLSIVMNFAQLIEDDADARGDAREFATTIIKESERMAEIVRNLLAFSRDERETHSPAEVVTLVESTVALIGASFRKDRIELTSQVPGGLPKIRCRSQQIQQVLLNLLINARDASNTRFPGASPDKVIRVTARAFEREGEPWVRLSVMDRGVGISAEVGEKLFDPFFTTKPKDQGTGLGLSISYGIVTDHGGVIGYESEPGLGTRFHVDLKAEPGSQKPDAVWKDRGGEVSR